MRIIEQLVYKITGDSTSFDKSINNTSNNVTKFSKIATVALTALSVGAIVGVSKKLIQLAEDSATALDRVDKMSQKIGLSREAFQEWDFILSQSGASVDGLQMSLKTLANASAEAKDGTAEYKDEFERLGIIVTDTNGNLKDAETLFNETFEALADMKDETQRTATASKLLGRSATELAPAMNAGSDSIESMRTQAHELGLVMGDDVVNAGVALTDSIDQLKRSFKGFKTQATEPLLIGLNNIIQLMLNQKTASDDLVTATNDIVKISSDYNTIVKKLNGSLSEQEELELNLAKIRKGISLQKTLDDFIDIYEANEKLKESYNGTGGSITLATERMSVNLKQLRADAKDLNISFTDSTSAVDLYNAIVSENSVLTKNATSAFQGYVEANKDAKIATEELKAITDSETLSINSLGEAVANGSLNIDTLQFSNKELYDSIIASSEAYKKSRDEEIEKANKLVKSYKNETDINEKRVEQIVEILKLNMNLATSEEAKAIYLDKINKLLSINQDANKTNTNTIANRKIIIDTLNKTIEDSKRYEEALGYAYDENTALSNAYLTAIKDLIDNGENPQSEKIQEITELYKKLNPELLDNAKQIKAYQTQIRNLIDSGLSPQSDAVQDLITKLEDLGGAYKFNPSELDEFIDKLEEGANYVDLLSNSVNSLTKGFGSAFADMGEALVTGEDAWGAFASAGVGALADVVSGLGDQLTAMAVAKLISFDFVNAGLATAGAIGAYTASGALKGVANSYEVGTMDLPYNQVAQLHKGETVLTAGITEEAKTQGITIEPKNKSNKSSEMTQINVYLGSKLIASEIVKDINSGNSGTISKRVVK